VTGQHHPASDQIVAYVLGDDTLPADAVWALEAHLDHCAACRGQLADAVRTRTPGVQAFLDNTWSEVDALATGTPLPARSPARAVTRSWATPAQVPWLVMSVFVVFAAVVIDRLARGGQAPSLVLLVSPVVPLLGVAAAWSRRLDPMWELTATTPRAGLRLVLQRTTAVLVVVIPVLSIAGGVVGVRLALCLLPCLALTVGALALGSVIGVRRAALALGAVWSLAAILPSLSTARLTVLLAPGSLPAWAALTAAAAVVVALRARSFLT
jgi:hypothetical protein